MNSRALFSSSEVFDLPQKTYIKIWTRALSKINSDTAITFDFVRLIHKHLQRTSVHH